MAVGEYASMVALYKTLPKFVPQPIGCGSYASDPNIHFFICEFIEMTDDIPEVQAFVQLLAELHTKGISPNDKYGFGVHTYRGTIPQYTDWHDTWEEAFHHSMKWFFYAEEKSQGPDDEMQELCQGLFDKVIPRLLRPLETGGRQIQPRLIHGDIWSGNTWTNVETNTPIIYDGACLYAHNESPSSMHCTIFMVHASERLIVQWKWLLGDQYATWSGGTPEGDFDDRNLLYYIRWDIKSSALFSGNLRYRNIRAKETMRTLIAKYPDGYEGWAKEKGEVPVHRVYSPTSYHFLSHDDARL
ncbi:putative protein-ribulosamine 3-kinase [Seiridium unicorne]|uniref:protein-ribulosamine 3-kinase n=1 Tax=Seiridium unicorne TaxID=138068 RepID=A0ABR2UYW5_9PEZI